ncbi:MAG: C10 family peptidase [Tannerella sp.]|nr:C10 family peptidase [Tannerella sp.]
MKNVSFEVNGDEGFAIVCSDPRLNRVYAYTEKGAFSDTTFNKGLAATLFNIPSIIEDDIDRYYTLEEDPVTRAEPSSTVIIGPLVQTTWNQTAPYNNNLATCTSGGSGGHVYTGCVTTAVAQVIAYYNFPSTYSNWYNLSTLRTTSNISTSSPYAGDIAEFMRVVGLGIQATFGCSSTSASMNNAYSYIVGLGYYNLNKKTDANIRIDWLYQNLLTGNIHLTSGFTKNPRVGHAWIWDGIYCVANSSTVSTLHSLHCNWGWGGYDDGWYANYEQPASKNKPYLDDNVQIYIDMY